MDQQNKNFPPSLISSLYSAWQQHHIPAIFYHYTLAILSKKKKQEQVTMMQREIKQLKSGNHMYHIITDSLQARQRSLDIIKRNVHILNQNQSAVSLSWTNNQQEVQSQGYSLIFQSRGVERKDNRTLIELINHLRLYQKVTYQVITSIHNWQTDLVRQGYQEPIQFLYKHQDYLQKILKDTNQITQKYPNLFENNPFLIFKRQHESTQFALIYQNLKFGHDFAHKITEALQIISNHDVSIQRHRILGNYKQFGPRRKITKSQSLHKIYCNYYNNKDFLIVKDGSYKSDKIILDSKRPFKFMNNRNILINPQINPSKFIERRHPVYLQNQISKELKAMNEQIPMTRSSSLSDFQVRKIDQKESLLLSNKLEPSHNMGKSLIKRLSLYDELDKTIKYKPIKIHKPITIQSSKQASKVQTKQSKQTEVQVHKQIIEQQKIQSQLHFTYQTGISQYELLKYLRDSAFKGKQMTLKDIQLIAKRIVSEKEYITFVKVTAGLYIAAWMAIKFLTKDQSIRKTVQIIFSYKFFKIPNFQQQLVEQLMRKGYGVIKQNGKIVHEIQIHEKLCHQAIKIKYKVNSSVDQRDLKAVIKKNECLKQSRILKYYHYSKQSKYHKYCDHSDNYCQIGYDFQQAFKITIAGTNYVRLRCDRITKVGKSYKIYHHLNNTELLIGSQLDDVLQFSSRSEIQFNSSFQQETEEKYIYLCLPQLKIMHKYLSLTEKPYIVEYLTVNGEIPEILSIQVDKKTLKNYLIMQNSFVIGIMCKNKQDFGKFLSILIFN